MKAMLTAFAATVVIAVGADFALDEIGQTTEEVYSGSAVRLGD